jgi:hypothetical protein
VEIVGVCLAWVRTDRPSVEPLPLSTCLNLAAARLRHIAGTQGSTRKYMNMAPLHPAKNEAYGAVIA